MHRPSNAARLSPRAVKRRRELSSGTEMLVAGGDPLWLFCSSPDSTDGGGLMTAVRKIGIGAAACLLLVALALPAAAQLTTGSVGGTVRDAQGLIIPGASITLVSESRGTKSIPVLTDENGDFVF